MIARYLLLSALPLLLSPALHAEERDMMNAVRCQSYDECTIVWGGCGDVAVNKLYAPQFMTSELCDKSLPHNPKALPTCTNGFCTVVIQNTENHSSSSVNGN